MRIRTVLPAALLAVSGLLVGATSAPALAAGKVKYPAYQCFKTADRDQYCSGGKVKNHAEGALWIKTCPSEVQKAIKGQPYILDSRPADAKGCPTA